MLHFKGTKDMILEQILEKKQKLEPKLDYIATAVDEIRLDNKARDREVTELKERVIRNEESVKSAHKRIDGLEEERGAC